MTERCLEITVCKAVAQERIKNKTKRLLMITTSVSTTNKIMNKYLSNGYILLLVV
jgi:hypothetical protein